MKHFIVLLLGVLVLSAQTPYDLQRSITLTHRNDLNILGQTSGWKKGDDLLTGILGLEYRDGTEIYRADMKAYTQKYLPNGERIDTLELGYLREVVYHQYENYHYALSAGGQIIRSGNFGGSFLQNFIHQLTGNRKLYLPYSDKRDTTFGVEGAIYAAYVWNRYIDLYNHIEAQINIDKSGYASIEAGMRGEYQSISFKVAKVIHYIKPFDHPIVIASTPDNYSSHYVFGAAVSLGEKFKFLVETTHGGAPLGEKDDYSTTIRLRYFLEP